MRVAKIVEASPQTSFSLSKLFSSTNFRNLFAILSTSLRTLCLICEITYFQRLPAVILTSLPVLCLILKLQRQSKMSASVESIDAVRNAFNTLLTNLTPAQVMTLAQQLQSSSPAPSASSPAASIETESIASPVQMTGNVNMGNSRTFNRTRINPHARKRPTNSYMVYRGTVSSLIHS